MLRLAGWLMVAALALGAHAFDSDSLRAACAGAVLALLVATAPAALRLSLGLPALLALGVLAFGGTARLLDLVPALIAGVIAWLFARTLRGARRPLIARAIAVIDGEQQLSDPAVARYARRLTQLWATYQALLALGAGLLASHAAFAMPPLPEWLPGPRAYGAIVLPLAVLVLLLGEYLLRPYLLPQAPRQHLHIFLARLVRAWPRLLDEG